MNAQLNTRALTLAGAVVGAIINTLCFTIYLVARQPDPWMSLFLGSGPTVGGWLIGIAEGAAVFAIAGALLAACYNRFVRTAA